MHYITLELTAGRLKNLFAIMSSGGPLMTITELGNYSGGFGTGPENGAKCVWFDGKNQKEAVFDVAVLGKATQSRQSSAAPTRSPLSRTGA